MGNNPSQAIQEILELRKQAAVAEEEAKKLSAAAYGKMQKLRGQIRTGESAGTGDRIKDFVIIRYSAISDEIESAFRALDEKVAKHAGEFVLMVLRQENLYGHRGGPHSFGPRLSDYHVDEHLFLGVLRGSCLEFNLAKESCNLPTGRHARCWNPWDEKIALIEQDIYDSHLLGDFGLHIDKPLKRKGSSGPRFGGGVLKEGPDLALEVKVGDEEVKAWFGKEPEKRYLVVFQKMAKLLERPVPESPELTAELRSRREAAVDLLAKLEQEAANLEQEIDRIYWATRNGIYSSGGAITVCENEDDAFWISAGPRGKLKEIIAQIKGQLAVAAELGMGDDEIVQRISKKYEAVAV